jgi:hypothetical protein
MAKKKRKIPARTILRRLHKKADKALSDYIRKETIVKYGKCPLCLKKPVEVCFHFVSRRRKILRWDARNVIGSCRTCNYVEQFLPDYSRCWYINQFGVDQYLVLVEESRKSFTPTPEYLQGIIDKYTTKSV